MSSEMKVSSTSTALRTGSEEVNVEKVGDELECSEAALKEIKAGDNAGTEGGGGHALELPDVSLLNIGPHIINCYFNCPAVRYMFNLRRSCKKFSCICPKRIY